MSVYFPGTDLRERWFRVRNLDVGSTMLVVGVAAVFMLVNAFAHGLGAGMVFVPQPVVAGELWRLVSWPFADPLTLWPLLNLFFLWVFGSELEQQLGRVRMAWLLAGTWAVFTVVALVVWLADRGLAPVLGGLQGIEFALLLLWIAEHPRRPFFFGIPAWVVGAVLGGLQLLGPLSQGDLVGVAVLLGSAALIALLAKQLGLLSGLEWIPGRARPVRRRASRQERSAARVAQQRVADDRRLDELLDKISAGGGVDALSAGERRELMRLRSRR